MDLEEVAVYRRNLQNYLFYKRKLNDHKLKLEELETRRLGIGSPPLDSMPVHTTPDPYFVFCKEEDLRLDIEKEQAEVDKYGNMINDIEIDLIKMNKEISNVIKNVYCLKKTTIYRESKKVNMDVSTLKRHINKEIWEIIKSKR